MKMDLSKIAIIGAGFSGAALTAALHKLNLPIEVVLIEKTGRFGAGLAYSTPYHFHLLNVRARDMSAFEDQSDHFVNWLNCNQHRYNYFEKDVPVADQFVPRNLYSHYLQSLLHHIQSKPGRMKISLQQADITDVAMVKNRIQISAKDHQQIIVDKLILASGNSLPTSFPFPVTDVPCIINPWDYQAPEKIGKKDPVLIVGTGLSMIDTVLTLYHQGHQGLIYAVSRHGLLPLPHTNSHVPYFFMPEQLPVTMRKLVKFVRTKAVLHSNQGGDWRSVINALRVYIPHLWHRASVADKKLFLRHVLPYWNVHRHRVHNKTADFLDQLINEGQLQIIAGHIQSVTSQGTKIKLRNKNEIRPIDVKWLINCMGPSVITRNPCHLEQSLLRQGLAVFDPLQIGLLTARNGALINSKGKTSNMVYTLGPQNKSTHWESSAVPEIRKQCFELANYLTQQISGNSLASIA